MRLLSQHNSRPLSSTATHPVYVPRCKIYTGSVTTHTFLNVTSLMANLQDWHFIQVSKCKHQKCDNIFMYFSEQFASHFRIIFQHMVILCYKRSKILHLSEPSVIQLAATLCFHGAYLQPKLGWHVTGKLWTFRIHVADNEYIKCILCKLMRTGMEM